MPGGYGLETEAERADPLRSVTFRLARVMSSASTQTTTTATIASIRRFIDNLFVSRRLGCCVIESQRCWLCRWPSLATHDQWVVAWNLNSQRLARAIQQPLWGLHRQSR